MEPEKSLGREFEMTQPDFDALRELVHRESGIKLAPTKQGMVYARLSKRLRSLGLQRFSEYRELVSDPESNELSHLINAITTNLTFFYREQHHFDFLRETALPQLKTAKNQEHRIRIWSAGCSTGEEPYSIAITMDQVLGRSSWDCRILATDLDTNVLDTGRRGIYDMSATEGINPEVRKTYFLQKDGKVKVKSTLHPYIRFRQLNLLKDWPMKGLFDIIFCRNVLIYFDHATQERLFDRYAEQLRTGGYLILGHSESMPPRQRRYDYIGRTIYQKVL